MEPRPLHEAETKAHEGEGEGEDEGHELERGVSLQYTPGDIIYLTQDPDTRAFRYPVRIASAAPAPVAPPSAPVADEPAASAAPTAPGPATAQPQPV